MSTLPRILFALLLMLGSPLLRAQDSATPPGNAGTMPPAQALTQLRQQLNGIKTALSGKTIETPLADLRTQALDVQQQADQIASTLTPQEAALKARLSVLGPAPTKGSLPETSAVSSKRRQLNRETQDLDAHITQAQQISQDSLHLATQIASLRREQFQTQLGSRTGTPFSRAFWTNTLGSVPGDMARVRRLGNRSLDALDDAWQPPTRTPLILCLVGALLLLLFGRRLFVRWLLLPTCQRMPDGHLRRSVMAVGTVLSITLGTGLAAMLVHAGLNWNNALDDDLDTLSRSLVQAVFFAAFVAGLGQAVLSTNRPSWRLPALSDAAALKLRGIPWLLGASALLLGVLERISSAIGASLPATVAIRGMLALVISGLFGVALFRLTRARRALQSGGETPARRPLWVGLLLAALVLGVVLAWLAAIVGYVAFAFFVAWQMLWLCVIVATVYLLVHLLDDGFNTLLDPHHAVGRRLQASFGLSPSSLAQAAAVLSGLSRVLLLLCGVAAVLAPFGAGPQELLTRIYQFFGRHTLGELPIKPGSVLKAIAVFVIGLLVVRTVKRWLVEQLLPKTSLDPGVQNSAVTLLGYVAVVLVFALALAALDVPLQSIAWIASALSVGIGFGLQAIVQNFISGLILLAEQPVKVGDWVSLADVEGDIRRINVRATEIQLGDRSTMIVPNSQLITQNVRNVTHSSAQGRVRILLPMPLSTDADAARQHMLEALRAHASTLEAPTPVVRLDDISASAMTFSIVAYVRSPRDVSGVKSDLLFDILKRLSQAKLPLSTPQSMLVRTLHDDEGNAAPAEPVV